MKFMRISHPCLLLLTEPDEDYPPSVSSDGLMWESQKLLGVVIPINRDFRVPFRIRVMFDTPLTWREIFNAPSGSFPDLEGRVSLSTVPLQTSGNVNT